MGQDTMVVTLSKQELMRLEMICIDNDRDDALVFVKEIRSRIANTVKGMKSHLDS